MVLSDLLAQFNVVCRKAVCFLDFESEIEDLSLSDQEKMYLRFCLEALRSKPADVEVADHIASYFALNDENTERLVKKLSGKDISELPYEYQYTINFAKIIEAIEGKKQKSIDLGRDSTPPPPAPVKQIKDKPIQFQEPPVDVARDDAPNGGFPPPPLEHQPLPATVLPPTTKAQKADIKKKIHQQKNLTGLASSDLQKELRLLKAKRIIEKELELSQGEPLVIKIGGDYVSTNDGLEIILPYLQGLLDKIKQDKQIPLTQYEFIQEKDFTDITKRLEFLIEKLDARQKQNSLAFREEHRKHVPAMTYRSPYSKPVGARPSPEQPVLEVIASGSPLAANEIPGIEPPQRDPLFKDYSGYIKYRGEMQLYRKDNPGSFPQGVVKLFDKGTKEIDYFGGLKSRIEKPRFGELESLREKAQELSPLEPQNKEKLADLESKIAYKEIKKDIYSDTTCKPDRNKLTVTIDNPDDPTKPKFIYEVVHQPASGNLEMKTNNALADINKDHKMIVQFIDSAIRAGKTLITVNDLYKKDMLPKEIEEANKTEKIIRDYCNLAKIDFKINGSYRNDSKRFDEPKQ